ncbi:methyltransferase [Sorangium sp. So ce119]|uniref:methyltransferase n=1 Tax=Sorangium sp. So ce119 TaxID=3133279 RepID=UPI003F61C2C7
MIPREFDLLKIIAAEWASRAIYIAVKFELIERLAEGQKPIAELSRSSAIPEDPLRRVLRVLVKLGLLAEHAGDTFELTSLGSCLRAGAKGGLADWTLLWGEEFRDAYGGLPDALRADRTAFDLVFGSSLFEYVGRKPDVARRFDRAMTGLAEFLYAGVVEAFDFKRYATIVDVGGGQGTLLASILRSAPGSRGVLFDQPHVIATAGEPLRKLGVADRCRLEGGDFFQRVARGGDLYVLSNIIHDWDDKSSVAILTQCKEAMGPRGRLLLVEMALGGDSGEPDLARMTDLNMLALTGGKERTREEFAELLAASGFRLERVTPVQPMTCLVEAVPA